MVRATPLAAEPAPTIMMRRFLSSSGGIPCTFRAPYRPASTVAAVPCNINTAINQLYQKFLPYVKAQSRQSTVLSFLSSRLNWDYPTPSHAGECVSPPPLVPGGDTLACGRVGGGPNSNERTDTVVVNILCVKVIVPVDTGRPKLRNKVNQI
jgi:hypothetical protein